MKRKIFVELRFNRGQVLASVVRVAWGLANPNDHLSTDYVAEHTCPNSGSAGTEGCCINPDHIRKTLRTDLPVGRRRLVAPLATAAAMLLLIALPAVAGGGFVLSGRLDRDANDRFSVGKGMTFSTADPSLLARLGALDGKKIRIVVSEVE